MADLPDPHARRNFVVNAIEGAFYISGAAFTSVQTVLPALVIRLGGGNVAVGAVSVIAWVGVFLPQILAARYTETLPWKKPWAVWVGLIQRTTTFFIGLSIVLFGSSNPAVALAFFLVLFSLSQTLLGVATPGWFDLVAKLTPARRRGRLAGIRNSLGGVGGLLCGLMLTWFLGTFEFPTSYALAFFSAFVMQMVSIGVQWRLVEREPSKVVPRRSMVAYLRGQPHVFRENPEFKTFITASAFQILASIPVGFFTAYAMSAFGARGSIIGEFTLTIVAIQVVSALVNGIIADRYGNKVALVIAAIAMLCASVWALVAPSLDWFRLVYMFLGISLGTEILARYNMAIEYGPVEQRSSYIGLTNTVLAPFYLSSLVGGWISDTFGYAAVFGVGVLFSLVAISLLISKVKDPRT
ncbi:MAG: MFS transporter [Ignavibacteriae bacterium]|nr:MFS transporter [Ignavibacteriota bacterium]